MGREINDGPRPAGSAKDEKRELKRQELADSAILALSEHGYANTTMRDIAKMAEMSLGMLHYYFKDKDELLLFCVNRYKLGFVRDIHAVVDRMPGVTEMVSAISAGLVLSMIRNATTHRLWYDMRGQAMFDPVFRPTVAAIEIALRDMFRPFSAGDPEKLDRIYASTDGLFRYFLQRLLHGENISPRAMEDGFRDNLMSFL